MSHFLLNLIHVVFFILLFNVETKCDDSAREDLVKEYQNIIYKFLRKASERGEPLPYIDAFAFYDVFTLTDCSAFNASSGDTKIDENNGIFAPVYDYNNPYEDSTSDSEEDATEDQTAYGERAVNTFLPLGTLSSAVSSIAFATWLDGEEMSITNKISPSLSCSATGYDGKNPYELMKLDRDRIPTFLDVLTGRFSYPTAFPSYTYYNMYFPVRQRSSTGYRDYRKYYLKNAYIPSPYTTTSKNKANDFYKRPVVYNEFNQLLLEIIDDCTASNYDRDNNLSFLAGPNNSFTFTSYGVHSSDLWGGRDVSETAVLDTNNPDEKCKNRKTKYPMYQPVANYILSSNDIYMNLPGIATLMRSVVCGKRLGSDKSSSENLLRVLTPLFRYEASDAIGTGIGIGFHEKNVGGINLWISDGDWPGWSNRIGVYIPQTGVGNVIVFFIQTNIKDGFMREAFTDYTVRKLIFSTNLSKNNYRSNNPWKDYGNDGTKRYKGYYEPFRTLRKYILSTWLRINTSMRLNNIGNYIGAMSGDPHEYSETVPGVLTPKQPLNVQINLISFPDAANPNYLVYGNDAIVKQGEEGLTVLGPGQFYVIIALILICLGTFAGQVVMTVKAYKFYAQSMKEQKKQKRLEQSKMQRAKQGIISTDAGAALANTGLSGGIDDVGQADENPMFDEDGMGFQSIEPVKKFKISDFVLYILQTSLILLTLILLAVTTITPAFVMNNVSLDFGVSEYSICGKKPSWLNFIPALDTISLLLILATFAFYGMQWYFYKGDMKLAWVILVPISGAILLAIFIWGCVWSHYSTVPSVTLACEVPSQ